LLESRPIDTAGLEVVPGGKTFRWRGAYMENMNVRVTEDVQLNVFGDFRPHIPEAWRRSDLVFLANGSPVTQEAVLDQVDRPALAVADTMNLWIETTPQALRSLLRRIDGLVVNDEEAEMLTGTADLTAAERALLEMGPRLVIVKRGSEGARLATRPADEGDGASPLACHLPAWRGGPVRDPTGAGDSFAGGMMGYLASLDHDPTPEDLRTALVHGTVAASFTIEDFGVRRLADLTREEFEQRLAAYERLIG